MMDYTPMLAAAAEAAERCKAAKAEFARLDHEMRRAAIAEATESLAAAGVTVKTTLLTYDHYRRKYEAPKREPILIQFITCWSSPADTPKFPKWQLQLHYAFARKDGKPNASRNEDYANITCEHPSGFAAVALERFPPWVGK